MSIETGPGAVAWGDLGVDVVLESSGRFRSGDTLAPYFRTGPPKGGGRGAGERRERIECCRRSQRRPLRSPPHNIVTAASSTTNCLAPVGIDWHRAEMLAVARRDSPPPHAPCAPAAHRPPLPGLHPSFERGLRFAAASSAPKYGYRLVERRRIGEVRAGTLRAGIGWRQLGIRGRQSRIRGPRRRRRAWRFWHRITHGQHNRTHDGPVLNLSRVETRLQRRAGLGWRHAGSLSPPIDCFPTSSSLR